MSNDQPLPKQPSFRLDIKPGEMQLSGNLIGPLALLVECGPMADKDIPLLSESDTLVTLGLAVKILVQGEAGYRAATLEGAEIYRKHYKGATVAEATINRKAVICTKHQ